MPIEWDFTFEKRRSASARPDSGFTKTDRAVERDALVVYARSMLAVAAVHPERTAHLVEPREGETACGDRVFVRSLAAPDGVLLAVIDGLGHGLLAEEAALAAERSLREAPSAIEIGALFDRAHAALRGTRGVAMTAVLMRGPALWAAGVGNVALRMAPTSMPFLATPGVVGGRYRSPRVFVSVLKGPARLYLHTDGVSSTTMDPSAFADMRPDEAARSIMAKLRKRTDDAAVLVVDL